MSKKSVTLPLADKCVAKIAEMTSEHGFLHYGHISNAADWDADAKFPQARKMLKMEPGKGNIHHRYESSGGKLVHRFTAQ